MKNLNYYFKRECGRSHPFWDYALILMGLGFALTAGTCAKQYIEEKILRPIKKEIYYSLPYKSPIKNNLEDSIK